MKKQFDFLRNKGPSVKEINLSFTQCQDKNESKNNTNEIKDPQINQSLAQVEISFWKKNIAQLQEQYESLKSFDLFKEKQLSLLKCQLNLNNNNNEYSIEKKKKEYETKIESIKNKYKETESNLNIYIGNVLTVPINMSTQSSVTCIVDISLFISFIGLLKSVVFNISKYTSCNNVILFL